MTCELGLKEGESARRLGRPCSRWSEQGGLTSNIIPRRLQGEWCRGVCWREDDEMRWEVEGGPVLERGAVFQNKGMAISTLWLQRTANSSLSALLSPFQPSIDRFP